MPECTRCGVDHDLDSNGLVPLYDVEQARREVARARKRRDTLTRSQCQLGDSMAHHINAHFSADELETAGRALLIAAGSLGALAEMKAMQPTVLVNILGMAGDRLITDGQVTPDA